MHRRQGFTILELLIVIVVIGILAVLVVVAYKGVQRSAVTSSLISDLETASRQLAVDRVTRGGFADDLSQLNDSTGLRFNPNAQLYYSVYNDADPQDFCLTATLEDITYKITSDTPPVEGACSDQLPSAPALSTAVDSETAITVSWDAVENASTYRVEMSTADVFTGDGTGACSAPECVTVTGTATTFSGLTQNTDYYFRAFTINTLGTSDESDHVVDTTQASTPAGAPTLTAGTATCSGTASVALSWTAVDPSTSYTLQYGTSATVGTDTIPTPTTDITGLSYTVTGLTCGTKYYFRVAAVNGAQGPWSNIANKTTVISTPGKPSVSVSIPGSARAGSASYWAQSYDGKPGGSGTWYYAQASVSGSSCPSGTTRQFRTRIQYNSPTTWGAYTGWSTSTNWYGVGPNSGYGIRFAVYARCYTSATTSSTSTVGYGCRWRSGSTSCSGF